MALANACDRNKPTTSADTGGAIVSLSPAATDLLLAMDATDRLVGVSTFDFDERVKSLPRVGDYETVDWERIASLAPRHMFVQIAVDRLPPGFRDRAASLKIQLHTVKIDVFTDLIVEAEAIGNAIGQGDDARKVWHGLRDKVDEIRAKVDGRPKVKTLIVTTGESLGIAGTQTYLDDVLTFAGGVNVVARAGYGKIDREMVMSLAPEAIIQLAPDATPAQREAIDRHWQTMPDVPAVKNGRVLVVTDPWALMPNSHVAELAERIARHLHREAF